MYIYTSTTNGITYMSIYVDSYIVASTSITIIQKSFLLNLHLV